MVYDGHEGHGICRYDGRLGRFPSAVFSFKRSMLVGDRPYCALHMRQCIEAMKGDTKSPRILVAVSSDKFRPVYVVEIADFVRTRFLSREVLED